MNQIKIGNFMKELRKEQKLTQEELAEMKKRREVRELYFFTLYLGLLR